MSKVAGIIGASGLVGNPLLELLLKDDNYQHIYSFSRKSLNLNNPRLTEVIGTLTEEEFWIENYKFVDVMFCCIGTTRAKTPDLTHYKSIDYGIPIFSAKAGLKGGLSKYLVISSMGANKKSKTFYSKIKGEMEEALMDLNIPQLSILRPSLILGKRNESRVGESIGVLVFKAFSFLIPSKYKGIEALTIAKALHHLSHQEDQGQAIYQIKFE